MVYEFTGYLFQEGQRAFISIPFNVWEECAQKGNIPAKITINDFTYECKLIPKGNGTYLIPIAKTNLKNISLNDNNVNVSLKIINGLSRINSNSPYSLENPIRKIDTIKSIIQPRNGLCGHACVSMLTGISLDEVTSLMGSKCCSMSKVIEALDYYGINHSKKMFYNLKPDSILPKCCIININNHYLLHFDGTYYDPAVGTLDKVNMNEIVGYLEILA